MTELPTDRNGTMSTLEPASPAFGVKTLLTTIKELIRRPVCMICVAKYSPLVADIDPDDIKIEFPDDVRETMLADGVDPAEVEKDMRECLRELYRLSNEAEDR